MNKFVSSGETLVKHALKIGALELVPEGRELKNGRVSPHFWNSGLFMTGEDLDVLASVYADAIADSSIIDQVDVIFGPAYKGIPLVAIVAMKLWSNHGINVEVCFNRKEKKDYADGGMLVGADLDGKKVLMIDDVITDGGTKDEATGIIEYHGGNLIALIVAHDRDEWADEGQKDQSALLRFGETQEVLTLAASNVGHLLQVLEDSDDPAHQDILPMVKSYAVQYRTRATA